MLNSFGLIEYKNFKVFFTFEAPERILDAPDVVNDFYLNLIDWSLTNLLAVALGPSVYLWNADKGDAGESFSLNVSLIF